ncbi:hypothetical protein BT63DRAFT_424696 [Microthyrium microscopicum]|uniref:Uncharacterized protein n=1 Tax=Microthyrium microscopicum TaxID=703497 RepID=A0A6A6UAJ2_9PEZI|nr:hypothetical protein BT63DRAFT_424696 [Microthyrium microscopicum]
MIADRFFAQILSKGATRHFTSTFLETPATYAWKLVNKQQTLLNRAAITKQIPGSMPAAKQLPRWPLTMPALQSSHHIAQTANTGALFYKTLRPPRDNRKLKEFALSAAGLLVVFPLAAGSMFELFGWTGEQRRKRWAHYESSDMDFVAAMSKPFGF